MLTKKQIEKLPNGWNSNSEIAKLFPSHGLLRREKSFPVNEKREIIPLMLVKEDTEFIKMRLNRQIYKKYS